MTTRLRRALTILPATLLAVLTVGAGTASAHVRVSSADAVPGGYGELTFRVPNESDTASTVSLRVQIPADTPLASVSTRPVPGWTASVTSAPLDPPVEVHGTEVTEAVSEITWTAGPGAGIAPGQYQTFSISGGPFPDVDAMTLPAIQTYDDGMESAWIEPTVDGQEEPEHPAPVLALAGDGGTDAHGEGTGTTAVDTAAGGSTTDGGTSGLTVTALVVGAAGLLAGLTGVALALQARRRPTP